MEEEGVEFSGRTVDDAVTAAEQRLGVGRDQLIVEVLTQGSRGVFGIGAESARILVKRAPQEETTRPAAPSTSGIPGAVASSQTGESQSVATLAPESTQVAAGPVDGALAEDAQEVLARILSSMGFDVEINIRSTEDPVILEVNGDNLGVLIGRRGDNLSALQFMVNLILSKNRRQWPRVIVDVENYRARREDALRTLAERTAYQVRRNGRPFTLDAMPAGDRRVIHLALRDRTDIETYSIGEGPSRRVVVAPKRAVRDGR